MIAEKPSVSQAIAKVIGAYKSEDGYLSGRECLVSWCLGHLAEYVSPESYDTRYRFWQYGDLPIIPQKWELAVSADKKEQFEVLKDLLNRSDLSYVVNACDAGREGELIFQRVYELSGSALPVKRLWVSSMEDTAIRKGFEELKEGSDYENLCQAAISRAQADWLIGMNATRAFTTTYGKTFKVGRVQTPTLAMLVDRQERIEGFRKEAYYKVALTYKGMVFLSENMEEKAAADALAAECDKKQAVIRKVSREQKKSSPPKLYDLTSLQREANRYFGYTAKKTLDILQELYEEKLVTYQNGQPVCDGGYVGNRGGAGCQSAKDVSGAFRWQFQSGSPCGKSGQQCKGNRPPCDSPYQTGDGKGLENAAGGEKESDVPDRTAGDPGSIG